MAGLDTSTEQIATRQKAGCCGQSESEICCEPETGARADAQDAEPTKVRGQVRERYAAAAVAFSDSTAAACGCGIDLEGKHGRGVFGATLYDGEQTQEDAQQAVAASLGCGVPTAVADLHEGETVLDLGSGAGADVLISARRVAPTGRAIGLDMTDEMLELAKRNAQEAGLENVEFRKGYIEDIPLPDDSVDVVISNCVLNLSGDKPRVLREAARVLRRGGRFAISDVIADEDMDEETRADMRQHSRSAGPPGVRAGAHGRRAQRRRNTGDPPSPRARRRGSHPRPQACTAHVRVGARASTLMHSMNLPMAGACTLGENGMRRQLERYRAAGLGASLIARTPRRLTVKLDPHADGQVIDELIATERECCPFFDLVWEPAQRQLTFAVSDVEHEPALEAISLALDIELTAGS